MVWDPSVLRKYSTTSHFRLLNQVRSELKSSPLSRNQRGELTVGMGRKGSGSRVPVEVRGGDSPNRASKAALPSLTGAAADRSNADGSSMESASFRERLRAIEMR